MYSMEMDPAFVKRDAARKAGQPVEIAVTDRLVIRETILEDVPALYAINRQERSPGVRPPMETLEEELEFMKAYISHAYLFCDFGLWTVLKRESGQVIGQAGLMVSDCLEHGVELGYQIALEHRRNGYGLEACRAIVEYAFEVLGLPELYTLIPEGNEASVHLAKRLGFESIEMPPECGDEPLLGFIIRKTLI